MMGATLPLIHRLGNGLENYPSLNVGERELALDQPWRTTEPDPKVFQRWQAMDQNFNSTKIIE